MTAWILAFKLALREVRGGLRGLRIVLACLALGVGAIACIGLLHVAVDQGLKQNGQALVGGDLEIDSAQLELPDTSLSWLHTQGARTSAVTTMRSLLVAPNRERVLIDLKAVDGAYPLIGTVTLSPPMPLASAFAPHDGHPGLIADQIVLDRLGLHPGDPARLGDASFFVNAVLIDEPDRSLGILRAPQVIIARRDLAATGLVQPGSMLTRLTRSMLPPHQSMRHFRDTLHASLADQSWHIRDARDAVPSVGRFFDQIAQFMTLASLATLLIGGIGVATGVATWLQRQATSIAIFRALGASARSIQMIFAIQIALLAVAAIAIGLGIGAVASFLSGPILAKMIGTQLPPTLHLIPLATAATYGILVALAFSWPALARTGKVSGAVLFRSASSVGPAGRFRIPYATMLAIAPLIGFTIAKAQQPRFAASFCGVTLSILVLFYGASFALAWIASKLQRIAPPAVKLGLSNLARTRASSNLLLISIGLGLTTLVAIASIGGNIRAALVDQLPVNVPSFYFIDIQNDQVQRFVDLVKTLPSVHDIHFAPSLRARIVAIKGVSVETAQVSSDSKWALQGDRGLTVTGAEPVGTRLVGGQWWVADYNGPPLLSLDAGLAHGWQVGVGDTIRLNVLGRNIDFKIASLRLIDWRSLGMNFALVASPGLLSTAPHANIATIHSAPGTNGKILRDVTDALPNVTGIQVSDVLAVLARVVHEIETALMVIGGVTLLSGALVLAGTIAATQSKRLRHAVILRAVGATTSQLRLAWLIEFGGIGLMAGSVSVLIGSTAGWAVVTYMLHGHWQLLPAIPIATVIGATGIILACGAIGSEISLRSRPGPLLRGDG